MARNGILFVYPKMGMSGAMVCHIPLGPLYSSIASAKAGFHVDLADIRLHPHNWRQTLASKITDDTLIVGMTVMTGAPIGSALEMSRWIKTTYPQVKVVWGGPHVTFNAASTLSEPSVDYAISGYGSAPLCLLAKQLRGDSDAPALGAIPGLVYRDRDSTRTVPPEACFEIVDYRDIPYHLVEHDLASYGQLDSGERIFPMYSLMGCPYHCAFCSSPAQYRRMTRKVEFIPPARVVDHVEYVHAKYGATYIYFIDDDSFVSLKHVEDIIDEIRRRNVRVKLGFRGARVSEIKRMDDAYLKALADAGTDILHIGAESGSQKILDLIRKDCTVEDIIEVNRKLARRPEILAAYNWIVGLPGEDVADLEKTRLLILQLLKDNPRAIMFIPNTYRPLPGTALYEQAVAAGYAEPTSLEKWSLFEAEGNQAFPWYTKEQGDVIKMMQVTSYFIDGKINKVATGKSLKFLLLRLAALLYSPIARARFRHGYCRFPIEYALFHFCAGLFHDETPEP